MPTEKELNQIWTDIGGGKFKSYAPEARPERLVVEKEKHIMSTPTIGSTARHVYERHPNGLWREVTFIGDDHPFA